MWLKEIEDTSSLSLTQGSILEGVDFGYDNNPLCIVLSNACDFEHDKLSFVVVAALVEAKQTLLISKEYKNITGDKVYSELNSKQREKVRAYIKEFVYNKRVSRYYFFNPEPVLDCPCLLVDFQQIKSFSKDALNSVNVIGELNHPFIEQLMMRFASYIARIPSDSISCEEEKKIIDDFVDI